MRQPPRGRGRSGARRGSIARVIRRAARRCSTRRPGSFELHPRIDHPVQQIGDQVDDHRGDRDINGHRLDHRKVASLNGQDHLAADAGNREEALDQKSAREQPRQLDHHVGDDRNGGIAQHVHPHHASLAHALRPRGANVVLIDLVEKEAAVKARIGGERNDHPADDRQQAEPEEILGKTAAPALDREPAELVREHVLEHDDVNEDADRLADRAADHHHAVGQGSAHVSDQHCRGDGKQGVDHQERHEHRQRRAEPGGEDRRYFLVGRPALAEIAGRNLPVYIQLWIFIQQIATGDFGESWSTNEKVSAIFATRLGPSLTVLVPLLVIDTLLAIAAAMLVAYVRGSLTDRMVMIGCTIGQSISILVYIIVFQYVLAYQLGWFPVQGWGSGFAENLFRFSLLPIIVGVIVSLAPDTRLYRTFFLDEINQDSVRTARAKGMSETRVMWVHVLRNASIPIITNVMIQLPGLLAGAFLIERFFSIPGVGREVILAVERSDFPVIKAVTVHVAIATMIINLIADLLYRVVDPRVQLK